MVEKGSVNKDSIKYHYRRKAVPVGGDVKIPANAIGVNIDHEVPPSRAPDTTFIEWLEPADG